MEGAMDGQMDLDRGLAPTSTSCPLGTGYPRPCQKAPTFIPKGSIPGSPHVFPGHLET